MEIFTGELFKVTPVSSPLKAYAAIKSKLQHPHSLPPPTPGKPRAFDYLLCPGSVEFDLCLRGVGKIEQEVLGFKCFFFRVAKSLTAIKHVFGRDRRVERKRCSICE